MAALSLLNLQNGRWHRLLRQRGPVLLVFTVITVSPGDGNPIETGSLCFLAPLKTQNDSLARLLF